jgi:hypothetical protein
MATSITNRVIDICKGTISMTIIIPKKNAIVAESSLVNPKSLELEDSIMKLESMRSIKPPTHNADKKR